VSAASYARGGRITARLASNSLSARLVLSADDAFASEARTDSCRCQVTHAFISSRVRPQLHFVHPGWAE